MVSAGIGQSFQTAASSGPLRLGLAAAALAGLVSFASPCCIPLVPGYLSYLAGVSGAQAPAVAGGNIGVRVGGRWRVTGAAVLFVAGFTAVFVATTASVFGLIGLLAVNRELLQRIGGVVTIVMGLVFVGLIPALQRDTRPHPRRLSTLAGAPGVGCDVRVGLDPMPGSDAGRRVVGGRRNAGHHGRAWGGADRRLLCGSRPAVYRVGGRINVGAGGTGLAA
jgi:cytochrome c-type biogenesis protein